MTATEGLAKPAHGAVQERRWLAPFAVNVPAVLAVHRRGRGDPAYAASEPGVIWRACQTPDGPGTLRVAWRGDRQQTLVDAVAWGPGASWLLGALPAMLGAEDRPEDFAPEHPVLRAAIRRHRTLRIGRTGLVVEALVPAVLEQKVVGAEATRSWRMLLTRFGEPAPGPAGVVPARLRVPLSPAGWAGIASWDWHLAGVEAVRARTIAAAARVASRLEEVVGLPSAQADRRLQALAGIGPWTSAEVRQRACGDPDAVSVGDYHLPALVGQALVGHDVDDAGMLELLALYAGQRHRAATLASLSGTAQARRGPRNPVRDYRAF
jgi:3-methyladenine DNA glycosylase/8-oxoguanine DNA glycosylase